LVKEEKVEEVEKLKEMIEEHSVIGLIDMFKMPSKQLQEIRKKARNKALIKMSKKRLLKLAMEGSSKEKIKELEKLIPREPAVLFTQVDAFKFYSIVNKLKSTTFAKEGDVAQSDIKVSAGPTSLMPGPVISELTKAGIPAIIEEGKIAIKKDVVVVKNGDVISRQLAGALRKLGIETMMVGLNIIAIYDNGDIYEKDVLNFVNVCPEKIKEAFNNALNLSIGISYPTKENVKFLLAKGFNIAKSLEIKFGGAK